jgi:hypothetical protein
MLVAYRAANYYRPLRSAPDPSNRGRWRPPGMDLPVQFMSLHPLGPWAEMLRSGWREDARYDPSTSRYRLWAFRIPETAERITFENAERFGFADSADLVADAHDGCHRWVAERFAGRSLPSTVRVPSASLPGTENLIMFGRSKEVGHVGEPCDLTFETPTGLFAEETLVLPELIGLVHREGSDTPHPALQAWQLGTTYRLRDITSLPRLV